MFSLKVFSGHLRIIWNLSVWKVNNLLPCVLLFAYFSPPHTLILCSPHHPDGDLLSPDQFRNSRSCLNWYPHPEYNNEFNPRTQGFLSITLLILKAYVSLGPRKENIKFSEMLSLPQIPRQIQPNLPLSNQYRSYLFCTGQF